MFTTNKIKEMVEQLFDSEFVLEVVNDAYNRAKAEGKSEQLAIEYAEKCYHHAKLVLRKWKEELAGRGEPSQGYAYVAQWRYPGEVKQDAETPDTKTEDTEDSGLLLPVA